MALKGTDLLRRSSTSIVRRGSKDGSPLAGRWDVEE
jgi:hypothetical protein